MRHEEDMGNKVKRILGGIWAGLLTIWSIFLAALDWVGRTTLPDDWQQLMTEKLPAWQIWLFSTPWWVPAILAAAITFWLIWFSWPRTADVKSVKVEPVPPNEPPLPPRQPNAATRNFFNNEEIRVWELPTPGTHIIRNRVFQDCVFTGPVMIAFGNHTHMDQITFETENFEDNLIEVEDGRLVVGVYGFESCRFDRCRFIRVGIVGNRVDLERLREAMRRGQM